MSALIHALALWERDETKRLGQRVFRERLVGLALDNLPADLDGILATVAELPTPLRHAPGEQFGTRVRASVRDKLINLKPELRVAGIKDVRIRDIYSAGVYHYLTSLGITINPETPKPRTREPENPRTREPENPSNRDSLRHAHRTIRPVRTRKCVAPNW